MKFEQLRPLFLSMEFDEQLAFIDNYITTRTSDLQKSIISYEPKVKKSAAKKDKQLKVTGDQLALLKQLGLI